MEADEGEQGTWLILVPHPDSPVHWLVESLQPGFLFHFEDLIGSYRALAVEDYPLFAARCAEQQYEHAFEEDPTALFQAQEDLDGDPPFELNSPLPQTIRGWFPWQIRGFNKLKDEPYGFAVWDTGTGKTILASALIKYRLSESLYDPDHEVADLGLHVVKRHNKINTQRKMERIAGVKSYVVTGTPQWRERIYENIVEDIRAGKRPVVVLNYEKFRDDLVDQLLYFGEEDENGDEVWWTKATIKETIEEIELDGGCDEEYLEDWKKAHQPRKAERKRYEPNEKGRAFFADKKVVIVWDEMPMKLKTRSTALYSAVCCCLYDTQPPQVRRDRLIPEKTWQYLTNATPIEHDPEDVFNCLRLMDHGVTFGTVKEFRAEYVKSYNYFNPHVPEKWHHLDHMNLKLQHCMSKVSKQDPDIAALFPEKIEEPVYIEFDREGRKQYDAITLEIENLLKEEDPDARPNPLALMGLLQMYCDAPSLIDISAQNRELWEEMVADFTDEEMEEAPDPIGSELAKLLIDQGNDFRDDKHEKIKELHTLLTEKHPGEKTLIFTVYRMMLPILSQWLTTWGIGHVIFEGTDKRRQAAIDTFMTDPDVLVFLSTDAGSDSIDLEVATVSIDYDFPWLYSRIIQRRNRAHRVTSTNDTLYCYMLTMANTVEDRRVQIVANKLGYHEGIFDGVTDEEIKSARLDQGDLVYILTGSTEQ